MITRKLDDNLPRKQYIKHQFKDLPKLHSGQRKLLMSEIDFITRYYSKYDKDKPKYILYIGASPGHHINYLNILFPELNYILYDKVESQVELKDNVIFHNKYFDDQEAVKYVNKNIFIVCDIRNLDIKKAIDSEDHEEHDKIIFDDMDAQKRWCEIIKPKSALLKFRPSWKVPYTNYFDGDIYFQIWSPSNSIELRLVPDINKIKDWDNKMIDEVVFHYNFITRREVNKSYPCIGDYHESAVEGDIIKNYLKKFTNSYSMKDICEISLSITIFLNKYINNNIDPGYLKKIE